MDMGCTLPQIIQEQYVHKRSLFNHPDNITYCPSVLEIEMSFQHYQHVFSKLSITASGTSLKNT